MLYPLQKINECFLRPKYKTKVMKTLEENVEFLHDMGERNIFSARTKKAKKVLSQFPIFSVFFYNYLL